MKIIRDNRDEVTRLTLAPKAFDYQFVATLNGKGQGVETMGLIRGGRKGDQCYQKYNLVEDCIHSDIRGIDLEGIKDL